MVPHTAPALLVDLNPLLELFFREFVDLTALTEVMFTTLTVCTVGFPSQDWM